jgi:RND superfamily putative drug exporter
VAGVAVLLLAFAGTWGTRVFGSLDGGGFDDPGAASQRAEQLAADRLGRDTADVVVLYRSATRTVDDPLYQQAVTSTLTALPAGVVDRATTYWDSRAARLVSTDRKSTYAVLQLAGDSDQRRDGLKRIDGLLDAPGLDTKVGGDVAINRDINRQVAKDIGRAEGMSMPVVMILLLIIFGSLAAASLPLTIGVFAILGAFTAVRGITMFTSVSIFTINIITILGLGLAIDYGLFMVSRFREELPRADSVEDAVARTMATAGRTIAVSAVTVAISLASLLIFPQVFLRSMGFGGVAAVLVAMLAALLLLPALLGMLGPRIEALSVRRPLRRLFRRPPPAAARPEAAGSGTWYRIARSVMRRPVLYAVAIVAVLLALGAPFLRVSFGGIDARALPAGTESRQVAEAIDADFGRNATRPINAVLTLPAAAADPAQQAALSEYVGTLRQLPGATGAQITGAAGNAARVAVSYDLDSISPAARTLVERIRAVPPPPGSQVLVGGQTANLVDRLASIGARLPWMGLIVALTTLILLFLAFGSVVLPVKAVLMNLLSLSASFGAVVWIFQDGHLSGLLGFTPTGTVEATQPILVLAIVFGVSMDYEVFLLSRIREQYDLTGDNADAVATGLQRSGRIITSAALLLVVVVGAFSTSGITFIKLIGVAMAIAIVIDATVVRILLVPATMRLVGQANWYAPGPLRRLYARYGVRESDGQPAPAGPAGRDAAAATEVPAAAVPADAVREVTST